MAMASDAQSNDRVRPMTGDERRVIAASSLGTIFEWYDFYLYGALVGVIGAQFFSQSPQTARDVFALLAFAAGFVVRPFGALLFGRIGDIIGRKYTFLITILIMGLSTFLVGLLPNAATIGIAAPVLLIVLRLLQGLALGGEYGGAAIYVAEHAPQGRRGFYTSWIQTTATLGLFLALIVILFTRTIVGEEDFAAWGWRIPFLVSFGLLGVSLWVRLQLNESPAFRRMKEEGKSSKAPLTESFGRWNNVKIVLVALLGLVAGQGVVWYTSHFYALFFLQSTLKVDGYTANLLVAWSLAFGAAFFVFFGWLSDKLGRKRIILLGCLFAALSFIPIFKQLTALANPALHNAIARVTVTVRAEPASCGDLFNPVGVRVFVSSCDQARAHLAHSGVRYTVEPGEGATVVRVNGADVPFDASARAASEQAVTAAVRAAGYPGADDPGVVRMTHPLDVARAQPASIIALLFVLVVFVAMVYGPMAAALVELFPTRIRYTSMSLPYHIGNGWFGGLLPAAAFAMVAQTGDIYFGLWYPIAIAITTVIIGMIFLPETKNRDIYAQER